MKQELQATGTTETQNRVRKAFLHEPLGRLIAKNAMPAVASMLFVAFYQIVDGMMVGRRLGPEALASINILYPIFALLAGVGIMIGVGGNARIAVLLGAGDHRKASNILGLIISIGAGIGIVTSAVTMMLMPHILRFFGTSGGNLGEFAGSYLQGLLPFFMFMLLTFILEQSVRNDGSPQLAGGVMAGCALLNIFLDYLFLFVFDLGIAGAAVASGISQSIGAIIFLGYFIRKTFNKTPGLIFAKPVLNGRIIQAIVVNGSSEMLNSLAAGFTTLLFNRLILSHVGAMGVAAFTLVQYLLMVGMFIIMGIGNGSQPIFSYNYGAGLKYRVKGALWRVSAACTLVGATLFLLITWQTETAAALFLPGQPEVLQLTLEVAGFVRWSILFMPLAMLGAIYFTALEKAAKSLVVALSRGLILPVAGLALFPGWWGSAGIWVTPAFAEGVTVLIVVSCLFWKKEESDTPDTDNLLTVRKPTFSECHPEQI